MYSDPALIRKHRVNLSLSDQEHALLEAMCQFTGEQKSVLLREMLLERARQVLFHDVDSSPSASQMRPAQEVRYAA